MQTCKYLSMICAAALLGGAVGARAQETDAQAKAREALRQKMAELDAQDQQGKSSKPRTPAPAPAPRGEPAPTPTPPPPVAKPTPPPVVTPAQAPAPTTASDDNAREALRKKIAEEDAAANAKKTTPPPVAKPTPPPTGNQVVQKPTPPPVAQPAPTPTPPAPAPSSKDAKLAQLLAQYKSDQISAEQYHTQRAAILADK